MVGDAITPAGLEVALTRRRIRDGQSAEADRWMRMLNDRREECIATLARDGMAIEVVFRTQEGGDDVLYWFELRRAGSPGDLEQVSADEWTPLDEEHLAFTRRAKVRGHTRLDPQLVLMPPAVERAIIEWLDSGGE